MDVMGLRRQIMNSAHIASGQGNPVSFSTDIKGLMKQVKASFSPVQSGSGDPSPTNVRPITGWTGVNVWHTGKNLLNPAYRVKSTNGIAYYSQDNPLTLSAGTYVYSCSSSIIGLYVKSNGADIFKVNNASSISFILSAQTDVYFSSYQTNISNDLTFQLEVGETATSYAPYSGNSYPVTFPAMGKNLLTSETLTKVGNSYYICGGNTDYPIHLAAGTYTISNAGQAAYQYLKSSDGSVQLQIHADNKTSGTFTLETEIDCQIWFYKANASETDFYNIMLNTGETALPYEPYTNTVYGGYVDLGNGQIVAEWVKYVITSATSWNTTLASSSVFRLTFSPNVATGGEENYICNRLKSYSQQPAGSVVSNLPDLSFCRRSQYYNNFYIKDLRFTNIDDFIEEYNGTEFVYKLETPLTYQLTPQQINTLIGDNVLWSDANGNLNIKYWKH